MPISRHKLIGHKVTLTCHYCGAPAFDGEIHALTDMVRCAECGRTFPAYRAGLVAVPISYEPAQRCLHYAINQ